MSDVKIITEQDVLRITESNKYYADERINSVLGYMRDDEKKKRLENNQCKFCWYLCRSRIAGQGFTDRNCGICDEVQHFSSTCTDATCAECAVKYALCKHCGGDVHLRVRRKELVPS